MATFVPSNKGTHNKLHFEGYIYAKHRSDNQKISWRCERYQNHQRKCTGRAVSHGEQVIITQQHNHPPSPQISEAATVVSAIKECGVSNHDSPRAIVNASLVGVSDGAIVALPKIASLEKSVSRKRRRQQQHVIIPHSLAEIVIPDNLRMTRTALVEDFILADTGADDEFRIIIFASKTDSQRLANCNTWLADGTFKMAPEMFLQLWVIHGLYNNRVLPLIYCLLPNKRQDTYIRALSLILNSNGIAQAHPQSVIIDFEKAEENAFHHCIPGIEIHGCFFHYGQSIFRKIQDLGMQQRYGIDEAYNSMLKKFTALAFCCPGDVVERYTNLAGQFLETFDDTDQHQNFLEYFENTWVGRARRNPRFSIQMWNCKDITEQQLPRTNNSVESWHHAFQSAFGCQHPSFFKLLDAILNENVRVNAIFLKLQAGEVVPLYSRIQYQQANNRLLALIQQYNQRQPDDYLASCAHYVGQ